LDAHFCEDMARSLCAEIMSLPWQNGGQDVLENLKLACPTCNGTLSRYNHLTSFEERKALIEQKLVIHNRDYQEWVSKLRTCPTSAC